MVPVIDRLNYRAKLLATPKIKAFLSLIEDGEMSPVDEQLSEADGFYFGCLNALKRGDKTKFIEFYSDFARREPDERAPYVRDDYLLFVLLCGVDKFSADKTWLKKVLDARHCTTDECAQTIDTFKSLLRSDAENTASLTAISILYQHVLNKPFPRNELSQLMYVNYMQSEFPFYKSEFLNLSALRATDLLILKADIAGDGKGAALVKFEDTFLRRTAYLTNSIYYSVMILLLFIAFRKYGDYKDFIDALSAVGGVLGLIGVVLPSVLQKDWIIPFLSKIIRKLLGYKLSD